MSDRPTDCEAILTEEGLRKLQAELEYLRTVKRIEVADRIREALDFGDAWENPEYEGAKVEQGFIEGRIADLEAELRDATVISTTAQGADVAVLGSWVKLRDLEDGEITEYCIVGTAEADPTQNRISNRSPVAQAVLGHRVGERVKVQAPAGLIEYEIISVHRSDAEVAPASA